MSTNDNKKKLEAVLEDALYFQSVEAAFFGIILHEEEEERNRKDLFVETFKQYWNSLTPELQNNGTISLFVDYANTQHTLARISYLYCLLRLLVTNRVLVARNVCESIIESGLLKFDNVHVWQQSFGFIHEFLPQMDYKNVRAVFSGLLNLVKCALPRTVTRSQEPLVQCAKKVINMGLDRNVCLLPSYFVVNEIYKLYPVDNFHLHWALGKEFSSFVDSFKPLAQMVSITGHFQLFPIIGHSNNSNVWNLEASTLKFPLKGPLPYKSELSEPQKKLLRYVIAQPYSRDVVCSMLGLKKQQKQRCEPLEDLLVELIIDAMEKSEHIKEGDESHQLLWQHLSSQLIFFILFQFASFPHMVLSLHDKLSKSKLNKGRDHLMWVLLQFISGSIQKSALSAFAPVMKLFELLYPETEPIPVPSPITPESTISFSMACVWVHLSRKAKFDNSRLQKAPPKPLTKLLEYLYQTLQKKQHDGAGYDIALICNAYSTHLELFNPALQELVSKCYGNGQNTIMLPGPQGCPAAGNIIPLEMKLLDSLSVHAKMSLIHAIVTRILAQAKAQQTQLSLAPGLVETYSRLLVYMEIELLGIKGFIGQVLPTVLKSKAFGILHTLLEMFSYRLHHIQPHYRTSLLSHLHTVATVPFTDKIQLHLCVQNTTLRLIMGFENAGIQLQLSSQRTVSDPKHVLSRECEELNRVLILTVARAMHITGADSLPAAWCESILKEVQQLTPLRWSSSTLGNFPKVIQQFYLQNPYTEELTGKKLLEKIDHHLRKIKSLTNEEEIISYCTESEVADLFICILWKMLIDQDRIMKVFYQVLMQLRSRALSNYLGVFSDFVIVEFKVVISGYSQDSTQVGKRFQALNDLIWKYHVIPLDRMILSLVLRPVEDKNSQVCFCVIKYLLLEFPEFKTRVKFFVSESVAQHWKQLNLYEKHINYHEKFPERFYFEGILEANKMPVQSPEYLPTYFGNVCLRFIPVFDILIHRLLELPNNQGAANILESLLKELGGLFKFHDRPITYLYNTLHYYAQCMSANLKKKLVSTVINSQSTNYIEGWSCTKEFLEYLDSGNDYWEVKHSYMINVVGRFVRTILNQSPPPFPSCDWRFNEFTNPGAHALNITCIELMSIPASGDDVGNAVIDVICKSNSKTNPGMALDVGSWINGVALLLTSLPDPYLQVVNKRVTEVVQNYLSQTFLTPGSILPSFFDFINNHSMNLETYPDYILAIFHATWLHASVGQFIFLAKFLKEQLKPFIINEAQLLYIFCLFGPFLQRFQQERARSLFEVSAEFYYILEQVCRNTTSLVFVDVITDFLYHIKYMFVGDNLKEAVEKTIGNFHEPLQKRLKFMVSPKKEEVVQQQPAPQVIEVVNLTNS